MNGSDIAEAHLDGNESLALLKGKTSCHTWLKSAGMLMPMGYLIKNGYVTPVGDTSDINSLRNTIDSHFDGSTSNGNLQYRIQEHYTHTVIGMSEFRLRGCRIPKRFQFYCDNEDAVDNEDWCLDIAEYIQLPSFGQSPSHPVMYTKT